MNIFKYTIVLLLILINIGYSQTQMTHNNYITIPEIALLDIEPNTSDIILEFEAPSEPGTQLVSVEGTTKWINYTCTQSIAGIPKEITAQIASSNAIPGLTIELAVSQYNGNGDGTLGTSLGTVNLTTTAQTIISGIGGCYTKTGVNSGHELEYRAIIDDYSIFEIPATPSMDIIYTFTN